MHKQGINTIRLQTYDYSREGRYFITLCTQNRIPYFGKIHQGIMHLSELGKVAHDEWLKTPLLRPDMNLELGEFVVMPDHFHAILIIGKNAFNEDKPFEANSFKFQSKNLASVMRGYKSAVTMWARKNQMAFNWQKLYYEHIIRNDGAFERISRYILNNPAKWSLRDASRKK